MMQFDKFTKIAQETAQLSANIMQRYQHNMIDTEHFLLALLEQNKGTIKKILLKLNVNSAALTERLKTTLAASPKPKILGDGKIYITPRVKRIIDIANEKANQMKDEYISTEHLFLSILTERNTPSARLLQSAGITHENFLSVIGETQKEMAKKLKPKNTKSQPKNKITKFNDSIFIVHGHDNAMKEAVARTIEKIGLIAIVLHEKPSQGKTIIEKFTDYSDVGLAIVLLSPDDIAWAKSDSSEKKYLRARQNVIFELGFFIGKLGRNRVISLYRKTEDFDIPSDYSGVIFIPFDEQGIWRFEIIRELRALGYKLDANKLL